MAEQDKTRPSLLRAQTDSYVDANGRKWLKRKRGWKKAKPKRRREATDG